MKRTRVATETTESEKDKSNVRIAYIHSVAARRGWEHGRKTSKSMSIEKIETGLRSILTVIFCYAIPSNLIVVQTILSSRELKTYNTLLYFVGIAIADTLAFLGYIQNAIWYPLLGVDIEIKYLVSCRIIAFFSRIGVQTSAFLLTIAGIDRCLLLYSKRWRLNYSRRPSITLGIMITIFILEIYFHFHVLIFKGGYEFTFNITGMNETLRRFSCRLIQNSNYLWFYTIFYYYAHLALYSVLPYVITTICNIFVLIKVFHKRKRIKTRTKETQKNVTLLIVIASTVYVLLTLPEVIFWKFIYTDNTPKYLRNLIAYCINIGLYINHSSTFPVLMITSSKFRQQFYTNMNTFLQCCSCTNNKIMPQSQNSKVSVSHIQSKIPVSAGDGGVRRIPTIQTMVLKENEVITLG
ncbi:unnamed protein product [Didymodactylos carnosus]|uniref:G-protein coupled receptors family 1 profile domain-containing protein n=1 Tax=Didymodactylos carnosus TaxID=1234261 RepID=A0A814CAH6_9BILA|nr:unnamed protein product [Didymodactylos carnosus]CAF1275985.1 unnamed protein product [Didymodactylos carnosus]CAF3714416.1 unnamed protein product [Didymodactylos carnosus]CAF4081102.1 unnamed protein product [Didymodactylos carnosus]